MKFDEVTTQFVLTVARPRIRRDGDHDQGLGRDVIPRSRRPSRRPPRRRSTTTRPSSSAGEGGRRVLQGRGQEGLHARHRGLPHVRAEEVRRQVRSATGRRARSSASTRFDPTQPARPRGRAGSEAGRSGDDRPHANRRASPSVALTSSRERWNRPAWRALARWLQRRADDVAVALIGADVRLVPAADRLSLRAEPAARLDRGSDGAVLGVGGAVGRGVHPVGQRRDPLRHRLHAGACHALGARSRSSSSLAFVVLFAGVAARVLELRALHEARAVGVSAACGFDYLYSIYVIFVGRLHRQARRGSRWRAVRGRESPARTILDDADATDAEPFHAVHHRPGRARRPRPADRPVDDRARRSSICSSPVSTSARPPSRS